ARARPRAAAPDRARAARRGARRPRAPARDEPQPDRGDRPLPLGGLSRGRRVQRRAVRAPLVRETTAADPLAAGGADGATSGARPGYVSVTEMPRDLFLRCSGGGELVAVR